MSETMELSGLDSGLSTVSRVYLGLNRPDGGIVSYEDMQRFIDGPVSEAFPDGFTVFQAQGGWRDLVSGETIREPSAILEVAHGPQDTAKVRALAQAYKAEFGQQAVMIATTPIRTQFV